MNPELSLPLWVVLAVFSIGYAARCFIEWLVERGTRDEPEPLTAEDEALLLEVTHGKALEFVPLPPRKVEAPWSLIQPTRDADGNEVSH